MENSRQKTYCVCNQQKNKEKVYTRSGNFKVRHCGSRYNPSTQERQEHHYQLEANLIYIESC